MGIEIWLNPDCSKCRTAIAENPRAIQPPIITAADGTTVVGRDADSLTRVIEAGS